jgi:hypothetical protein
MEDLFAVGDQVLLDRGLHRTVTRVELEDEGPRIYVRLRLTPRTDRTALGHLADVEEGPFSPHQVMPYRPSKRARWRRRYGRTPVTS